MLNLKWQYSLKLQHYNGINETTLINKYQRMNIQQFFGKSLRMQIQNELKIA